MNHRYFYKRAYYIACLAGGICKSTECHYKLEYEYQDSNPLQPVLLVSPVKGMRTTHLDGDSIDGFQMVVKMTSRAARLKSG